MQSREDMYDQLFDRMYGDTPECDCDDGGVPYAGRDLKYWVRVHVISQLILSHRRYVTTVAYGLIAATVLVGASRQMSVSIWNLVMWALVVLSGMAMTLAAFFLVTVRGLVEALDRRARRVRSVARSRVQ